MALPQPTGPLRRIVLESFLIAGWQMSGHDVINESYTLYGERRFVLECPAPSTTIFLAMKNSIIFISALSLVAMMLASCSSILAPDETARTGVMRQTNEAPPARSAGDSVNSISGGHY
jgi:hypothetical protein